MNEFSNQPFDFTDPLDSLDISRNTDRYEHNYSPINTFDTSSCFGNETIFQHYDPLCLSNKFQMKPLNLHYVKPHYVQGYVREDGTAVDGYFRDGKHGAGYLRSNPDEILENN
ncbi:hypothetical protein IM538_21770 [Cytobacillus suaedae]|nr:hypothetical protein IM538_21770 [Cytobacillus suaedae]